MRALADAGTHTFVKISMLAYCDPAWDEPTSIVHGLVQEVLEMFGTER